MASLPHTPWLFRRDASVTPNAPQTKEARGAALVTYWAGDAAEVEQTVPRLDSKGGGGASLFYRALPAHGSGKYATYGIMHRSGCM